jgi:hypothetical protein
MEKPRPSITPLPASALFHFAFTLDEYAAIKAATAFFAEKLRDPREKDKAQRALAKLESPTGLSLPSVEGEGAGTEAGYVKSGDSKLDTIVGPPKKGEVANEKRPAKGLAGLGGKKA